MSGLIITTLVVEARIGIGQKSVFQPTRLLQSQLPGFTIAQIRQPQFLRLEYCAEPQDSIGPPWRLESRDSQGCVERREDYYRRVLKIRDRTYIKFRPKMVPCYMTWLTSKSH